jgi:hypothetical protein
MGPAADDRHHHPHDVHGSTDAPRVGRFFVDLMLTLAEERVSGPESAELVAAVWRRTATGPVDRTGLDEPEILVRGLAVVAAALADRLVAERRAAGDPTGLAAGRVGRCRSISVSRCAPE